ncbi:DUF4097 domain-containing protein [Apilactobacillus apisilvae]|uniref:DUF4097 domain-containing protein n=1 Tax=Apilactobacillus apisilvae TaxID=2923364 RepID=A0ABY4PH67_9LACO|nr:DUF4097 family beta strand repeat-containing protein [Apilactobacillus apisilvae]UQS84870.1 DUF4097 domain-containing protein [Apilactobacillus apisilvae]
MKTYIKISLFLLLIGLFVFFIGFAFNGFSIPQANETVNGKITQKYTKNLDSFNAVDLNSNVKVNVKSGNSSKMSVALNKTQKVSYSVDNGVLKLNASSDEWYHNFFRIGFLNGFNNGNKTSITLFVPKGHNLKYINQSKKHAGISLSDINVEKPLELDSVKDIYNVKAPSIDAEASNKDMTIENSTFDNGTSDIESDNGAIYVNNNHFKKLSISNENGDIIAKNNKINSGFSEIENENGDIELGNNDWYALELSNDNGDITFKHQNIINKFKADSENGDVSGEVDAKDNANIYTYSDDGDNKVAPDVSHSNSSKKYSFTNENGDVIIN